MSQAVTLYYGEASQRDVSHEIHADKTCRAWTFDGSTSMTAWPVPADVPAYAGLGALMGKLALTDLAEGEQTARVAVCACVRAAAG